MNNLTTATFEVRTSTHKDNYDIHHKHDVLPIVEQLLSYNKMKFTVDTGIIQDTLMTTIEVDNT